MIYVALTGIVVAVCVKSLAIAKLLAVSATSQTLGIIIGAVIVATVASIVAGMTIAATERDTMQARVERYPLTMWESNDRTPNAYCGTCHWSYAGSDWRDLALVAVRHKLTHLNKENN